MAQFAGGRLRISAKSPGASRSGNARAATGEAHYTIWDNLASPRVAIPDLVTNGRVGTDTDEPVPTTPLVYANGSKQEMLDLEVLHTAAITPDTSAHSVAIRVIDIFKEMGPDGREIRRAIPKTLVLGDRATNSTHPAYGWTDDTVTRANDWDTLLRYIPPFGHVWVPAGIQYAVIDGA